MTMKNLQDVLSNYNQIVTVISNRYLDGILQNSAKIDSVFKILSDEESKYLYGQEILMCIFRNYLNGDKPSVLSGLMSSKEFTALTEKAKSLCPELSCPDSTNATQVMNYCKATTFILEQYRYKDIVKIEKGDKCVDIGACLGDTAIYMNENGASNIYSFEIDRNNIACMKKTFSKLGINSVQIIQNAITNKTGTCYYTPSPTNIGGGNISTVKKNDDSYQVECTTIDKICSEMQIEPHFIKMDIEGAELDAIEGARNTLIKYQPKLAICIYHTWPHRWEIPLLLHKILPHYKFYLKKSHHVCETVLFGISQ